MNNLFLTFFLLFYALSSFETKRIYYKKRPCGGSHAKCSKDNLDDFHNDNGELIEKYYNQNSNEYFGLIDSFHYRGHEYGHSKNESYIVSCY